LGLLPRTLLGEDEGDLLMGVSNLNTKRNHNGLKKKWVRKKAFKAAKD
jgi:hypothetical protein